MSTALRDPATVPASHVRVLAPSGAQLARIGDVPAWAPFASEAVTFVADLSRTILSDRSLRTHPEVVAFGHWIRRRHLQELEETFRRRSDGLRRVGRGLAFHIAPANVDSIFLYSTLLSLLAGNSNVVRVSGRTSGQLDFFIHTVGELLQRPEHAAVRDRVLLIHYERDESVNAWLSDLADLRVVWGGDTTIRTLRAYPLSPLARDISFPDRWSLAVIDAQAFITDPDRRGVVTRFTNDAYWFGQMACSSPRIVVWRGTDEAVTEATRAFWVMVEDEALQLDQQFYSVDYVNKRVAEDNSAIRGLAASIQPTIMGRTNVVDLVPGHRPPLEEHCGAGLFFQLRISSLSMLAPLLDRKVQSIVSHGISKADWGCFLDERPPGIDRIVPFGQALSFSAVWDGMDLLQEFTRAVVVDIP